MLTESSTPRLVFIAFMAMAGYRMRVRDIVSQLVPLHILGEHAEQYEVQRKGEQRKIDGE